MEIGLRMFCKRNVTAGLVSSPNIGKFVPINIFILLKVQKTLDKNSLGGCCGKLLASSVRLLSWWSLPILERNKSAV